MKDKWLVMMLSIVSLSLSTVVFAAIYQDGKARKLEMKDTQVMIVRDENSWLVKERAALFQATFAKVYHTEDIMNRAESELYAIEVAKTTAKFIGSQKPVVVVKYERPVAESTNMVDQIRAMIETKEIVVKTIEINEEK